MNMPADDSLKELQKYIWQMNIDRGFDTETASDKLVLLVEEAGELAKAIREISGIKFSESTKRTNIEEELADVQIVLLGLASMLKVDIFDAVVAKEQKNSKRNWQ